MRKLFILFIVSLSFSYDWKLDFSAYDDGITIMRESAVSYQKEGLSVTYKNTETGIDYKRDLGLKYDKDISDKWSVFVFLAHNSNSKTGMDIGKLGYGFSYLINDNILHFPWRNKISVATVHEHNRDYLSLRYKFKGYVKKVGLELALFHLGYTWNSTTKLTYKLDSNISMFYKDFREDYNGFYRVNSLGIEIKL